MPKTCSVNYPYMMLFSTIFKSNFILYDLSFGGSKFFMKFRVSFWSVFQTELKNNRNCPLQSCLSMLSLIDHPLFMRGLNSSFEVYLVIIRVQPSTKSCYSRMLNLYFDFTLPRILNHDNLIIIPF